MLEQFRKGVFYTAIGKYSNVVIQLLVQAVLARIISPRDFGIVSAVNVFLVFFQLIADFGIGPAIIQNKELNNKEVNSIFSFSFYMAIALGILFMLFGYPMSWFYGEAVYINISIVLGICVFFYAMLVVPQSLLLKAKNFKVVNLTLVGGSIASGVISVVLAFMDFSYYSIIIGTTARAMTLFVVFYLMTKPKFNFTFSIDPLKKIYAFSRNQFLFNFINYFSRNLDNLLIGRFFSASALGYYDKAYQLSLYPNSILTGLVTSVIHPVMSDFQDEKDKIKNVYLRISNILGLIGMPLSVFLFFNAEEIIIFMFGNDWYGSVPTFQLLALSVWLQMILSSSGAIFQSGNRTDLLLLSGVLSAILNVTAIVTGVILGQIEYVALLLVIAFSVNFIQANYLLMIKLFSSSMLEFAKVLVKPALIAAMQLAVFYFMPELPVALFLDLVINGLIFAAVWFAGLVITGEFKRIKNELMR